MVRGLQQRSAGHVMHTGVICGTVTAVCGQLVRLSGVPSGSGTSYGFAHHFPP